MSGHTQIPVTDPFTGREVGIDEALVPAIRNLWSRDIETTSSCQGHPGIDMAVICFADPCGGWETSLPNGARIVHDLLAASPVYQVYCARWEFVYDDGLNEGSALLLPPADIPVLTRALGELPGTA